MKSWSYLILGVGIAAAALVACEKRERFESNFQPSAAGKHPVTKELMELFRATPPDFLENDNGQLVTYRYGRHKKSNLPCGVRYALVLTGNEARVDIFVAMGMRTRLNSKWSHWDKPAPIHALYEEEGGSPGESETTVSGVALLGKVIEPKKVQVELARARRLTRGVPVEHMRATSTELLNWARFTFERSETGVVTAVEARDLLRGHKLRCDLDVKVDPTKQPIPSDVKEQEEDASKLANFATQ